MRFLHAAVLSATFASVLTTVPSATAQRVIYSIDPAHSNVDFAIKHMAISTVHGQFAIKEGTVNYDAKNVSNSSVMAVLDIATVTTGNAQRDAHLKSADFFDTAKYPLASFKSSKIVKAGDGYDVFGDLTLHGVTKPVTLHMDAPSKEQIGMDKKPHIGFSATTMIHRQDFGLTWNGTLKSGDSMLGDDVKMTFDIEAGAK